MTKKTEVFGAGEVAKKCGVPRWRLLYLIDRGTVKDASFRAGNRRMFTSEDVEEIRMQVQDYMKKFEAKKSK